MTSEVFNGRRFGAWFKYDITQLWRSQMKAALGIGLSGLILYALIVSYNLITGQGWCGPSGQGRVIVFVFALLVLELRQTRTYGFLTEKSQGSAWLMTPASTLEKWTAMIINTLIIIPVLFFVVYFGVDWLLCTVDHSCGTAMISTFWNAFTDYKAATEGGAAYIGVGSAIWLLIASFCVNFLYFLLCGLCFKKHKILYGIRIPLWVRLANNANHLCAEHDILPDLRTGLWNGYGCFQLYGRWRQGGTVGRNMVLCCHNNTRSGTCRWYLLQAQNHQALDYGLPFG